MATLAHEADHHHGPARGILRWVFTTNHKDIGSLYLWLALIMFLTGGSLALLIRMELFQPGLQLVEPETFNRLTTMHGLIMVFGAVMPAWTGFANWMIPMMVGAPDMALPRMNNWSFWILPFAFSLLMSTWFWRAVRRPSAGLSTRRCPPLSRRRQPIYSFSPCI